ncbi:cation diffusion facilitator family transporter [Aestuariimicrobium sp. p3-SID1156]|uniref:cation diffusion facilitator family transporter n=1 Tax=Aestuariimicrobium sp. p3-SID1156 TaxID=2916038 RepID=UPI00223BDC17|nr:cation diffusion facilitator family transporter [Aestuariimicrobium sp. p3-SID1156]MCT1458742.1 cation diffusion facilitator family transporter [Aestuariimicrobium sp. p3-SID1156]
MPVIETPPAQPAPQRVDLRKYAWLSIVAALLTIALKVGAWWITGSVGLLSDAAESIVNLVAAIVALVALTVAARPPDKNHHFGHSKAEYFSAATEGLMIFLAASVILVTATLRFLNPQPLEELGIGLLISVAASVLNGVVGVALLRAGRQHRSLTLTADGRHLLTDVWTSVGVIVGVGLVWLTSWDRLDSLVAFAVGLNILFTGWKLITESTAGLMDVSLPKADNDLLRARLGELSSDDVIFHAFRTRESGSRQFMEVHMLVPGDWSVKKGHDLSEDVADAMREIIPELRVLVHLEPIEDPRSYEDMDL